MLSFLIALSVVHPFKGTKITVVDDGLQTGISGIFPSRGCLKHIRCYPFSNPFLSYTHYGGAAVVLVTDRTIPTLTMKLTLLRNQHFI